VQHLGNCVGWNSWNPSSSPNGCSNPPVTFQINSIRPQVAAASVGGHFSTLDRDTQYTTGGDTLSSRHVSSCDVNACSWDVRGDLTLNSMAQIHTSVTLLYVTWSRVELWSAHVPARLSNFCCRTHFVRRDVRVERSSDVTSCFQNWRKCLLKKCANRPFYMTPSHRIIEISIWEPTHGKG